MEQHLREAFRDEDVVTLIDAFFNEDISGQEGQQEIVRQIAFDKNLRIVITAFTRYGKTWSVALGVALYLLLHEDKIVNYIGPSLSQSKKFRQYLVQFVLECEELTNLLDVNASGEERIKKEVSKRRMTFSDGNEVNILTAGGSNDAQTLMGHGGDLIVLDESADIDEEVYNKRVSRMLGDSEDAKLVEIGNPWHKENQFFEHWNDTERFERIKIDWKQGLEEGRITERFVNEQAKELTDRQFKVLYEADFPDQTERGLIKYSWVEQAKERDTSDYEDIDFRQSPDKILYGFDIAGEGDDQIVLTRVEKYGYVYRVDDQWSRDYSQDTAVTANWAKQFIEELDYHRLDKVVVNIDSVGIGEGVVSELNQWRMYLNEEDPDVEEAFMINEVSAGKNDGMTSEQKDDFRDFKALYYWKLREVFQSGEILLPTGRVSELSSELVKIKHDRTPRDRRKIIDPDDSPDYADSLMLALSNDEGDEAEVLDIEMGKVLAGGESGYNLSKKYG